MEYSVETVSISYLLVTWLHDSIGQQWFYCQNKFNWNKKYIRFILQDALEMIAYKILPPPPPPPPPPPHQGPGLLRNVHVKIHVS